MKNWIVYILRCSDNSLYTGITKDLDRRIQQHNDGTGAKYTRAHRPVKLVWSKTKLAESAAKKEEARIKKLSKPEKEKMLKQKTS